MLHSISWQGYFLGVFGLIIIYYAVFWLLYFKTGLTSLSGIRKKPFSNEEDVPEDLEGNAVKIIGEIQPAFMGTQNKNELIYALQAKLQPYKFWDEPDFRETINAFIINESERQCSIHLSEEDLRVLWT